MQLPFLLLRGHILFFYPKRGQCWGWGSPRAEGCPPGPPCHLWTSVSPTPVWRGSRRLEIMLGTCFYQETVGEHQVVGMYLDPSPSWQQWENKAHQMHSWHQGFCFILILCACVCLKRRLQVTSEIASPPAEDDWGKNNDRTFVAPTSSCIHRQAVVFRKSWIERKLEKEKATKVITWPSVFFFLFCFVFANNHIFYN